MLHFSCDTCGKDLIPEMATRYVVKVEGFAAGDPAELTDDAASADHVAEMARLLREQEDSGDGPEPTAACKKLRFDLCGNCYRRFLDDPLGRDTAAKLHFSEN